LQWFGCSAFQGVADKDCGKHHHGSNTDCCRRRDHAISLPDALGDGLVNVTQRLDLADHLLKVIPR
jgi:hypothetical protein